MRGMAVFAFVLASCGVIAAETNDVRRIADLGKVVVEGSALSRYRPETVAGATFTDVPPEMLPVVVDTLTEDFIREKNPTDLNDLLRNVPGVETGGTSLMVRQPGLFTMRGGGGTEPAIDGVFPIGRGAGLFMDPFLMERVEVVKGPMAALTGGAGAAQNANGGSGAINLYMKGARLDGDRVDLQSNTSVGRHTFRQRGMADANETFLEGKGAVRVVGLADYYEPAYIHQGLQKGARGREGFTVSPSFVFRPTDDVTFGVKTLFQKTDAPSYIGVPVYRGRPGAGYGWYESSCRRGDRQLYEGLMVNPWLDWQVTENWFLKFGGSFQLASWKQTTQEPYSATSGPALDYYCAHGFWPTPGKYAMSAFSHSKALYRNYNMFGRSVYATEFDCGVRNEFLLQGDAAVREGSTYAATSTRYGETLQDSVSWGWVTLLGGVRYDYFHLNASESSKALGSHAVSPRGGVTVQPLDWLVFFGNVSQTRTPMFQCVDINRNPLLKPWYNTQVEGGVRVKTAERLWITLSTYRIEQENGLVEAGTFPGTRTYYYTQEGQTTSRGAELSVSGDITENWTVLAMYAFNKYTNRSVPPGEKGRDFERTPAHAFTASTSYRISDGPLEDVVLGGGVRFRSMSYATFRGAYRDENLRFDPSYLVDLNVSAPLSKFGGPDNWTLSLGVRNLLGEKYFDTSRHFYECFAGEPRTFEIGVRARF